MATVEFIAVDSLKDTCLEFKSGIKKFEGYVNEMESLTGTLLDSWDGKGRNQFETQYSLMRSQLKDISDILYEIYDALVDAQEAYINADEEIAKQISADKM